MSNTNYNHYSKNNKHENKKPVAEDPVIEEIFEEEPVVEEPIVEEPAVPSYKTGRVYNCPRLNVREEPSMNAEILTILEEGTEVQVDSDDSYDDFYKVWTSHGVEGYCVKSYILI